MFFVSNTEANRCNLLVVSTESVSNLVISAAKAATADLIIGVGRPDDSKIANEATFGILKNRNGADGFYLPAVFDTSRIFIELLPQDENIMVQKGNKSTNKKTEKNTTEDLETIKLVARTEGVVLDPVYTGKAFRGVLSEIQRGRFRRDSNILFIHTGGLFGLFAQYKLFKF